MLQTTFEQINRESWYINDPNWQRWRSSLAMDITSQNFVSALGEAYYVRIFEDAY